MLRPLSSASGTVESKYQHPFVALADRVHLHRVARTALGLPRAFDGGLMQRDQCRLTLSSWTKV